MGEAVLVFPAGMPDGLAFRDRAKAAGLRVVGASSLERDPAESAYETWEHLPYINDPGFDDALAEVVKRHGVGAIHTPHFVIWRHLSEHLEAIAPGAQLSGAGKPEDNERAYRQLRERVASARAPAFWPAMPPKPPLSLVERAGLIRLAETIPGMCGEAKMHAIIEVMRHAPAGDVVEIGAWWGKSAAVLVWLARRYDLGNVLCVDPWSADVMTQGDALLDSTSADLDTEEALKMFEINLAPLAEGRLNYLRQKSEDAAAIYEPGLTARTQCFGETAYCGQISVLHIDGNHAEGEVAKDCALWTPHVVSGGWIIFDDYEWAFGDGPRKVADAFAAANAGRIAAAFQAGPALFLQLKRHHG
jgi:Methyltransferase domain